MPPEIAQTEEWSQIGRGTKRIIQILLSSDLQKELLPLKIVFIILAIFFAYIIVYYSLTTSYWQYRYLKTIQNFFFPKIFQKKVLAKKWEKIKQGLDKDIEDQWKLSLIEAAAFLDEVLKNGGFGGYTLEERLNKVMQEDVSNISQLKEAQKVCSDIIHDQNYHLSKGKAKEVIDEIESALKQLEVL